MLAQANERTFVVALLPKGSGHIHTCISTIFKSNLDTLDFLGMGMSLPIDFFVKSTGRDMEIKMSYFNFLYLPQNHC